ncbi:MAG: RsiV family protein [Lachnospiraceae bacterium]
MTKNMKNLKKEYQDVNVPKDGVQQAEAAMERALFNRKKDARAKRKKAGLVAAAAAVALCITLPNTSASVAMAMEKIPVVGGLFKVVTFRDYTYEDAKHYAKVDVPEIKGEDGKETEAMKDVNKSVKEYTDQLLQQFKEDLTQDGYKGLEISSEVITDSEQWFTLEVWAVETQASAAETRQYYNIDKKTGEVVELSDLFEEDSEYVTALTDEVKNQMRAQMKKDNSKSYFIDSEDEAMAEMDFKEIKEDQNYYFNDKQELVIAFDEYEVAPGSMGCVEFSIPKNITDSLMK